MGGKLHAGTETLALDKGADQEQQMEFRGDALPPGKWSFTDGAGRTVVSHFDSEQVAVCYFNWDGPARRANLELWSVPAELQPGESLSMNHAFEFK